MAWVLWVWSDATPDRAEKLVIGRAGGVGCFEGWVVADASWQFDQRRVGDGSLPDRGDVLAGDGIGVAVDQPDRAFGLDHRLDPTGAFAHALAEIPQHAWGNVVALVPAKHMPELAHFLSGGLGVGTKTAAKFAIEQAIRLGHDAGDQRADRREQHFLHRRGAGALVEQSAVDEADRSQFNLMHAGFATHLSGEQFLRRRAAVGMGEDMHMIEAEELEQGFGGIGERGDGVVAVGRLVGKSRTGQVRCDHAKAGGQISPHFVKPPRGGGVAVQQQQRFSRPRKAIEHAMPAMIKRRPVLDPSAEAVGEFVHLHLCANGLIGLTDRRHGLILSGGDSFRIPLPFSAWV